MSHHYRWRSMKHVRLVQVIGLFCVLRGILEEDAQSTSRSLLRIMDLEKVADEILTSYT